MATPCDNEGSCLETNDTRTCDCIAGYTGDNCETGGETVFGKKFASLRKLTKIYLTPSVEY